MFSLQRTGSARNASNEAEQALKNYMTDPAVQAGPETDSIMLTSTLSDPTLTRELRELKAEGFHFLIIRAWRK